jgi:hypothetical protein
VDETVTSCSDDLPGQKFLPATTKKERKMDERARRMAGLAVETTATRKKKQESCGCR